MLQSSPLFLQRLSRNIAAFTHCQNRLNSALSTSASANPYVNVPAGHVNSDLSDTTCNIGLGRRRDLTLRQDLTLFKDGAKKSLADVFKGSKVFLVGFPGGKVCIEKHLPGYIQAEQEMKAMGVDKVVAVSHNEEEKVAEMAALKSLKSDFLELYCDRGGFMRLLGVEIAAADADASATGPKCQRFAAIVEDGVLLKLNVEKAPAELKVTDAETLIQMWKHFYG